MLPKFDGVVICEEFEAEVVHACLEREVAKNEAARGRREREAKAGWMKLIGALRMRTRLESSYKDEAAATGRVIEVMTIESSDVEDQGEGRVSAKRRKGTNDAREAVAKRLVEDYSNSKLVGDRQLHQARPGIEQEEI